MKYGNQVKQFLDKRAHLHLHNAALEKPTTGSIEVELAVEEALRYAESIVETIREPLLVLDTDLKIISANRNFYKTFKVTPGETIGSFIYDLGDKQWDIPKLRELLEEVLPEKEAFDDFEVEHNFENIGHKIMLLNARQIHRKDSGAKMILLAIEDITERKQLESILIDSEEQYRRLFETASDGIVLLEKNEGKITQANPAAEKLLGYTENESIGNKLQDIGISLDMDDFQTTMQNLNKIGILNYRNVKVKTKSGQHIDTEIYLVDRAKLVQCNVRDITRHKQAEDMLRQQTEAMNSAIDGMGILNEDGEYVYLNKAHAKIYGYENAAELIGKSWRILYDSEVIQRFEQDFMPELSRTGHWYGEAIGTKKNGSKFPQAVSLTAIANGGLICVVRDITERKRAEEKLRESEELFRSYLEYAPDAVYMSNLKGNFLYGNRKCEEVIGYRREELIGKNFLELNILSEKSLNKAAQLLQANIEGKPTGPDELELISKEGRIIPVEISTSVVQSKGEGIVLAFVRDITDRKRTEEALRETEEKHRWVLDNMADVITVMDMNLRFTYVSPSIMNFRGYTAEEAMAQTFEEVMTPESLQISAKAFEDELQLEAGGTADPDRIRIVEVEQYKKDGSIVLMENHLSFMRDEAKKPVGIIAVSHDITQRRRAENELIKAKILLDKTFASLDEAIIIVDSSTRNIIACNHATEVVFGFGEKDLIGCSTDVFHVDKLSYDLFGQELFPALDANGVFRTEFQMRRKDGSVFPTENTVTEILDDSGHRTGVVSVVRDITARKMAEKNLKQANIFLDSIIENIPNMIFLKNARDLRFIRLNRAGEELLGYSRDDLLGKSDYDFFPKEQADHFTKKDRDVLNGKVLVDIPEESVQTRTKGERTIHTNKVPLLDEKGKPEFLLGISEDITERKKMEETLRKHDVQLQKLTSWMPGMMYQFTRRTDGTFSVPFSTDGIKDIFGCSARDVLDDFSPIIGAILPEDLDEVVGSIEYSAANLTTWICEYRVQIPGQSIRWILGKSTPEKLADGSITWYGFNTDITETKKVEEALKKSEEEFRSLAESMPQIVWVTRKDGWNIYFNKQWVAYTGLTLEESYGHGWNIPFHPDDKLRAWDAWENATKNNGIYSVECRLRRADGVYHWWLIRGVPLLDETGEIIKWFGTCTDIDNIKLVEKQLQDTLENLRKSFGATIQVLISAVEARDPYTSGHQIRTANLALAIATEMGLPQEKIETIRMAGPIHDIGKLSVPSEILAKPTKLSEIEFALVKEHPAAGYEILKDVESPWPLAEIVYQHHERMDGSGYPRKLKGDEILIEARIMAVADTVEAMASHRPYRPSLGIEAALNEIEKNKGKFYDADAADACLRLFLEKGYKLE